MVEMPGGGLDYLGENDSRTAAETKRVIRSLQVAKEEIRKNEAEEPSS